MSQGQNVAVDVLIGSKCHCGHSELGRFVQASCSLARLATIARSDETQQVSWGRSGARAAKLGLISQLRNARYAVG